MSQDLDRLLDEVLEDPELQSSLDYLLDAVSTTKHVDDELLAQHFAGTLEEPAATRVRRHVLFCDHCSVRLLDAIKDNADLHATDDKENQGANTLKNRRVQLATGQIRSLRVALVSVVLAVFGLCGWVVAPPSEGAIDVDLAMSPFWAELVVVREDGIEIAASAISGREELGLRIENLPSPSEKVYVLAMGSKGKLVAFHPEAGGLQRESPAIEGGRLIPNSLNEGPVPRGWRLLSLADPEKPEEAFALGILVLIASEPVPALEGELRDLVVLPDLIRECDLVNQPVDEVTLEALGRLMVLRGFARSYRSYFTVVKP